MSAHVYLLTWWRGKLIGQDKDGNRYYEDRRVPVFGKARRWVIYKGIAEASKVSSEWYGWLHYTVDCPPLTDLNKHQWQKDHEPNRTGTVLAYKPGSLKGSGKCRIFKGYEPWKPMG